MWTTEIPKECGFYWWREGAFDEEPTIVEIDRTIDPRSVTMFNSGSEIPRAAYMREGFQIDGEFWSERLAPPSQHEQRHDREPDAGE